MSTINKNVVTPLKKEPVMLFGTSIPNKAIALEKPKAPPPPPGRPSRWATSTVKVCAP